MCSNWWCLRSLDCAKKKPQRSPNRSFFLWVAAHPRCVAVGLLVTTCGADAVSLGTRLSRWHCRTSGAGPVSEGFSGGAVVGDLEQRCTSGVPCVVFGMTGSAWNVLGSSHRCCSGVTAERQRCLSKHGLTPTSWPWRSTGGVAMHF